MIRSTLAIPSVLALLAGCGGPAADNAVDNALDSGASLNATTTVEDVPSDSLAAPENLELESESNSAH